MLSITIFPVDPPPIKEIEWVCVNGHGKCGEMYPGPDCPYCEPKEVE